MKFSLLVLMSNSIEKIESMTIMTGTLHEDVRTFIITSRSVLLRMRNISDKICGENQNTHFVFHNSSRQSRRFRDNVEICGRDWQVTDGNMAHAHCMLGN